MQLLKSTMKSERTRENARRSLENMRVATDSVMMTTSRFPGETMMAEMGTDLIEGALVSDDSCSNTQSE